MKRIFIVSLFIAYLTGCANPAQIEKPILAEFDNNIWGQRTLGYQVSYAQPTPGLFTGGDVVELQPISQVQKSIYSSRVLSSLDDYIKSSFPKELTYSEFNDTADYTLQIDIVAFDKKGPSYSDYLSLVNFSKLIFTLGINKVQDYDIIADFKMNCRLYNKQNQLLFEKGYKVKDILEHEEYTYNITSSDELLASELFKKHINVNLNNFFKEVESQKVTTASTY